MKKIFIIATILTVICTSIDAQNIKVTYAEEPNVEAQIQDVDDPVIAQSLKAQLEGISRPTHLYYNKGESLYTKSNDFQPGSEDGDINIVMDNNDVMYKNHQKKQCIAQEAIFEKRFLIEEPFMDVSSWKLENDQNQIAGYNCKKAINKNGIIAWYATDIPISDGPANYMGLPGLILMIETPQMSIIAKDIDLDSSNNETIKVPTTGKKVTRVEYDELFEKKIQELQANYENGDY